MRTRNNSSRKPRDHRKLRKRFLIVTDGMITEQGYFERIKQLAYDSIKVVARNKDIDKLVELAKAIKEKSDYDTVAMVCDIDQRLQNEKSKKTLMHAISVAEKNGIIMCMSHESFEIWLLAHLGQVKSSMKNRAQAHDACIKKGIMKGSNGKEIVAEKITRDSILAAMAEVKRLRNTYGDSILVSAPMTEVDKIMSKIVFD